MKSTKKTAVKVKIKDLKAKKNPKGGGSPIIVRYNLKPMKTG